MSVFMMPSAPGTCQVCAAKHDASEPHNAQSLPYQMWFKSTYGRDVTWADAMAHCSDDIQEQWIKLLNEKKAWTEPEDGKPIPTLDTSGGIPTARPLPNMEPQVVSMKRGNPKRKSPTVHRKQRSTSTRKSKVKKK